MTKLEAIEYILDGVEKYFDEHPKAKTYSAEDVHDNLADLCDADYQGLCKAMDAKCQGGHTDPLICAGVFADAVNIAMDEVEATK